MNTEVFLIVGKIRACLDAYENTENLKYINLALGLIKQIKYIEEEEQQ